MKLETRTDIEKLLCKQLELLAEKSKESDSSELQGLTAAMLDVSNYLVENDFDMNTKIKNGEFVRTPKENSWSFDERIKLQ